MKTEKLEKQTLTWLVFSANVIVGAMVAMWHSEFVP